MSRGKLHSLIPTPALVVDEVSIYAAPESAVVQLFVMLERHISRTHHGLQMSPVS